MFPGYKLGETTQRIASAIFEAVSDYELGIQFVSSYIYGRYVPHVRMMKTGVESPSLATEFGIPYVIIREPKPYDTTTLNYNWQLWNCHAFSMYTDATEEIHDESAQEVIEAILRFLKKEGVIKQSAAVYGTEAHSEILLEREETIVTVSKAGFLIKNKDIGMNVRKGEIIAKVIDTYEGSVIKEVEALKDGIIFYACQKPVVYTNLEIYKIV